MNWDKEADVVVVGAGATGLPAAIQAREDGASVILIDANVDVGGHAILSGGNVPLGGGTSAQKKYGIVDSPDLLFADLTDWSVVEANGAADYRYNDREILRAFADNSAPTYEWLAAHGVVFVERTPDNKGAGATGNSALRENHCAPMEWPLIQTGKPVAPEMRMTGSSGIGLIRPLEVAAKKAGVQILLEHRMSNLLREEPTSGRVLGLVATSQGKTVNIRAKKGVILATGGSMGNVNFRRMVDPRLTEEYCGVAGEPWTVQDASGEIAAMAVGASLWGLANQAGEVGSTLTKPNKIGAQYGYVNLTWLPSSSVFPKVRAIGLTVRDWQNVILVNQIGRRFYDETKGQFVSNKYNAVPNYVQGSYLNAANVKYAPQNWLNAAMAGVGDGSNGGGPIWAIFDAEAAIREGWNLNAPHIDREAGFFFSGNSIEELARNIQSKYQRKPMPAETLKQTIEKYNTFVDGGRDLEFGKPEPRFKLQTPPYHAAWATPVPHDTRSGLRINAEGEVVDMNGKVIAGLYCGGETAGGFNQHGLARCTVQGRIAGRSAAKAGSAR